MKCVYSFWSKPFLANIHSAPNAHTAVAMGFNSYAGFSSLADFLHSWVLSTALSSQHYGEVELVTDTYGKTLLVDRLHLPFSAVHVALDRVPTHVSARHWSLSKIVAYSLQTGPFVHVDADVYLWKRLPAQLETAPVFGQNTDSHVWLNFHYTEPYFLMYKFLPVLPDDFTYTPRIFHPWDTAICCGILGGQDWRLIRDVAQRAVEVFCCDANKYGWEVALGFDLLWGDRLPSYGYISVVEQYGIARECWARGLWKDVAFLLDEAKIATDMHYLRRQCAELGYTHLIDHTKKHPDMMARLRKRIAAEYAHYLLAIADIVQQEQRFGAQTLEVRW
jgi:hypothetical protein